MMHYAMPISQRLKKLIKSLHQKPFRDQNGLFLVEGEKLANELLASNFHPELIVVKDAPSSDIIDCIEQFSEKGTPIYTAPKHQFDQICDTKTPQNVLAVVNIKHREVLKNEPFIALDGISDPGNVGTIIRTADWFGYKQVILGKDCADIFNPKTVRGTMGAIFKTHLIYEPELAEYLKETFPKHKIYGASSKAEATLQSIKPKKLYGIVLGSESHGLSEQTKAMLDGEFKIEGKGSTESLNVAVAASIAMYHLSNF
ncbi:MAG: RNA methyltransferase [Candidatus Kapabacteria bacterium]|nr:RNA methyltransferase [Candidatus Kapabacteria bacterium]